MATSWHFTGQHRGIEHFELYTNRCAFLDHHLEETFTLTHGTTWGFAAAYCGTIDAGGLWTGVGTFEITAGDSSGLSGTFTDSAQLPSAGVPYVLNVNSGSGVFAGASGSCALDNHLRMIEFGVQEQSGSFVCDLHR